MKYQISVAAQKDMEDIWLYTYEHWSLEQADRYINLILDEIEYLAKNPQSGKNYSHVRKGYFRSKSKSHLLFYKIHKQKEEIEIIRVLHQKMDRIPIKRTQTYSTLETSSYLHQAKKKEVIYITKRWRWIALLLKVLPNSSQNAFKMKTIFAIPLTIIYYLAFGSLLVIFHLTMAQPQTLVSSTSKLCRAIESGAHARTAYSRH